MIDVSVSDTVAFALLTVDLPASLHPALCRDIPSVDMLVSSILSLALAGSAQALNILLNNDDGFASGNLREVYRLLKEAGHNGMSPTRSVLALMTES